VKHVTTSIDIEHAVPLPKHGDFFIEITPSLEDVMRVNFRVEVGTDEEDRNLDFESNGHDQDISTPGMEDSDGSLDRIRYMRHSCDCATRFGRDDDGEIIHCAPVCPLID
jgi:hypothetical protein